MFTRSWLSLTAYSSCSLHWLNICFIEFFTLRMFSLLSNESRSLYTMCMTKPNPNEFFKSWIGPMHFSSPSAMMAKRLQRNSHSSMLCDVKTIFLFVFWHSWMHVHMKRLLTGSTPVVGSSSKIRWGTAI